MSASAGVGRLVACVLGVVGWFGVMLLIGCTAPGVAVSGASSPPSAQTILHKVQQAQFKDATFSLSFTGSFSGTSGTGTGTGKITKHPERSDISLTVPVEGQPVTLEVITDVATSSEYSKITNSPIPGFGDQWIQSPLGSSSTSSSLVDTSQITSYLNGLTNVRLVGSETIDGTAEWHIKGTTTQSTATQSGESGTTDLYVTKDTYLPKKVVETVTGSAAGTFTLLFTAYDTGITINLPPADQVQSGTQYSSARAAGCPAHTAIRPLV
jgi:hypothetical protein